MNKKSINRLGLGIASMMIILVIGVFMFIFFDQGYGQFVIEPLHNVSTGIANSGALTAGYNATLYDLKDSYDNRLVPYDMYFIFLFLIAFIGSSASAIQARRLGIFSFFGYMFLFSMLFLLIMFFVGQFTDYFINNIFGPLFNDTTLDIPVIDWFFRELNVIAFVWFLWLGFINQVDLKEVVRSRLDGGFQR